MTGALQAAVLMLAIAATGVLLYLALYALRQAGL